MKTRIIVPEGMSSSGGTALAGMFGYPKPEPRHIDEANCVLRAALRWLTENPIVPTEKQFAKLYDELSEVNDGRLTYRAVVEWQRVMFSAPKPNPVVEKVKQTVMGTTLTNSEANEITAAVWQCVSPTSAPKEKPVFIDSSETKATVMTSIPPSQQAAEDIVKHLAIQGFASVRWPSGESFAVMERK